MQNSIWKIVSAIGIVGIGTLVVLEVQHRLPPSMNAMHHQNSAGDADGADPSEFLLTPDADSEFDQLMSGADASDAGFDFSEPAFAQVVPVSTAAAGSPSAFPDNQNGQPPFEAFGETPRESAAAESPPTEVRSASFQQDGFHQGSYFGEDPVRPNTPGRTAPKPEPFGDDLFGAPEGQFQADDSAVPLPKNPVTLPPFGDVDTGNAATGGPTFGEADGVDVDTSPAFDDSAAGSQSRRPETNRAPNLMFFGEGGSGPAFEADAPAATSPPRLPVGSEIDRTPNLNQIDLPDFSTMSTEDDDFPSLDVPFQGSGTGGTGTRELPDVPRRLLNQPEVPEVEPDPFAEDVPFSFPETLPDVRREAVPQPLPGLRNDDLPAVSGTVASPEPAMTETLRPHLSIRKQAPETASVGVPMDYTIVVVNEGQSPAYDVIVEDQLGRGISLTSTRPKAEFDRSSGRLTWQIGLLQPQERQEFLVQVTPSAEGTMDGVATVRFKAQVRASTVITAPRLSLRLTGTSEVKLGEEVRLMYVVRNEGSGVARDVILRSVLPFELRHSEGRDLEYEISSLEPQEEREIQLTVVAAERANDTVHTSAEVTSAGIATATAEVEIRIVAEQLSVERLGPERRYVGRTAQFQNIITNNTNFEALNAVVLEQVPQGMRFVEAPGGSFNPETRVITWTIDRIAPGKQVLLDVELMPEISGPMDAVVEVVENAGFRSKARRTVSVEDLHNVSADVSRMEGPVAVGERFTFTITVDNRGTATANEVQLTVQVPAQIRILAAGDREQGITARLGQGNVVVYNPVVRVEPKQVKTFQLVLQGQEPVRNGVIKAQLRYAEMQEPLVVSESVTVYSDSL